jgi:hypothetical protein
VIATGAGFRARVAFCGSAESCASLTRSRSSVSSRNCAWRSVSIRVSISRRALARDKRFKLRPIFAPKAITEETTTQDSLWIIHKFNLPIRKCRIPPRVKLQIFAWQSQRESAARERIRPALINEVIGWTFFPSRAAAMRQAMASDARLSGSLSRWAYRKVVAA